MKHEKMLRLIRSGFMVLKELDDCVKLKSVYDYMYACALEKVNRDILVGKPADYTAVDNVSTLMNELLDRIDASCLIVDEFSKFRW